MKYSIVIPTHNNYEYLSQCINGILSASPGDETEIIVVDNGSTDETAAYLAFVKESNPTLKIVTNNHNTGFCTATNQGMEVASGDYIIWMNDDAIPSPYWLEKMERNLTDTHTFHPNIGITGPMSNYAAGLQQVEGLPPDTPVTDCTNVVQSIEGNYPLSFYQLANKLSGFCMMMKREVYDTIGGIDERYSPGGFCDNDFCLRAIESGYGCLVSPNVFVYHYGSITLNREYPASNYGVHNWAKFISKYRDVKEKKIIMIQGVKIDDEFNLEIFKKCAKRNLELVDGVVLLSDRSEHFTYEDAKEIFGDKLLKWFQKKKTDGCDGIADRHVIIEAAKLDGYDWVVYMDHDEAFGPNATPEKLQRMMNPYNPALNGYKFLINTYWRHSGLVRVDKGWGTMFLPRMWKNNKFPTTLRPRLVEGDKGFHAGNRPLSIAEHGFSSSTITIDHYGYIDYERTLEKKKFYETEDNIPDKFKKDIVGPEGYDHLANERDLQLIPTDKYTLALNMMVKNEENPLGNIFLSLADLVDEIVLIDTGSDDATKERMDEIGFKYLEKPFNDDFSEIRNMAIDNTTSDYCWHVDADEQFQGDFLSVLPIALNNIPDVVLVEFVNAHKGNIPAAITKQPRIFKRSLGIKYNARVHETIEQSLDEHTNLHAVDMGLTSINTGFIKPDDEIDAKLMFYGRLLEMEISESPNNPKAHLELAAHYRNIGKIDEAMDLLSEALRIKHDYLAARRELVILHLHKAWEVLRPADGMDARDKTMHESLNKLFQTLKPWVTFKAIGNPNKQRFEHEKMLMQKKKDKDKTKKAA